VRIKYVMNRGCIMSDDIEIKNNCIYGGWREPINQWQDEPGSIHKDSVAHKVGLRGGTIPGTIHLNLYPPLFLKIFGNKWFEKGSISLYYTYATVHLEKVRAVIKLPDDFKDKLDDCQLEAWVETQDGNLVAKGTVSAGVVDEKSYIQKIELKSSEPGELRILKGLGKGDDMIPHNFTIGLKDVETNLKYITDPLDYYRGQSPWGAPIVSPSEMYLALMVNPKLYNERSVGAVGFFGATELCNISGPIKLNVPYLTTGKIACVGTSLKTEFFWYDSVLEESETGKKVATMRKLVRFMKASSKHYSKS
jgi:hypothetical protein